MRNLTFLASPAIAPVAASFRRSFMEKTASWSVAIEECHTRSEAAALLLAKRSHAFVVSAQFRQVVFEAGKVQGASARLAQGADILYRGGKTLLPLANMLVLLLMKWSGSSFPCTVRRLLSWDRVVRLLTWRMNAHVQV